MCQGQELYILVVKFHFGRAPKGMGVCGSTPPKRYLPGFAPTIPDTVIVQFCHTYIQDCWVVCPSTHYNWRSATKKEFANIFAVGIFSHIKILENKLPWVNDAIILEVCYYSSFRSSHFTMDVRGCVCISLFIYLFIYLLPTPVCVMLFGPHLVFTTGKSLSIVFSCVIWTQMLILFFYILCSISLSIVIQKRVNQIYIESILVYGSE